MGPLWVLCFLLLAKVTAAGTSQNSGPSSPPPPPNVNPPSPSGSPSGKANRPLGPCQSCRLLVTSFENGLEKTANLPTTTATSLPVTPPPSSDPSPPNSDPAAVPNDIPTTNISSSTVSASGPRSRPEVSRFEEIIKSLCSDVTKGKEQCAELVVSHSNHLQEWYQLGSDSEGSESPRPQLLTWLCIEKLQVCCPANHFGPNCFPCAGYPDDICSGHGKCKGNGTRKGNGACNCDKGYVGPSCNSCAKFHYEAYRDKTKLICSPCHRACAGGCSGAGTKHCDACNEGWETDDERGCLDLNECLMLEKSCNKNEFCVNTEGSYACFDCDRSCEGCTGDGPDMCDNCAPGYTLIEKLCIDNSSKLRDTKVDIARYLTYFGLCVSTCIIFQKNMTIAGVIGVLVGMYIAFSEYLLNEL